MSSAPPSNESHEQAARAHAQAMLQDAKLAADTGRTPEQLAARRRVVEQFCQLHLADFDAARLAAQLQTIDLQRPVQVVNLALIKKRSRSIFTRPTEYLASEKFPPTEPGQPIYALKFTPPR